MVTNNLTEQQQLAVLQTLGIDPAYVEAGSVELIPHTHERVGLRFGVVATVPIERLTETKQ